MELYNSQLLWVLITATLYIISQFLHKRINNLLLNPVLITLFAVIAILLFFDVDYEHYQKNTEMISFWLNPSVVALAIPLYLQMKRIKKDWKRIFLATFSGSLVGIISVVLLARLLGANNEILLALAPKSVSTPIAINISETIGGIPSLTAAVVVITGILGAVLGETVMRIIKVKNPNAVGLAIGTASHALGTSKIAVKGEEYSSYSAMGLAINGILTSILVPIVLKALAIFL